MWVKGILGDLTHCSYMNQIISVLIFDSMKLKQFCLTLHAVFAVISGPYRIVKLGISGST